VVVQGCNNAPSYICNDQPSCAPVDTPVAGFYSLDCHSNAFTTANGDWSFGQTIVFDRKSAIVAMPHPIVRVECQMQTRPGKIKIINTVCNFVAREKMKVLEIEMERTKILLVNSLLYARSLATCKINLETLLFENKI
jgi:hypothetical protein